MTLVVCIDNDRGMTFFGRRQSTDRAVCERIAAEAADARLLMNVYSASRFRDVGKEITVCADPASEAKDDDVCFIEDADPSVLYGKIDKLIIYRWNKKYPRDRRLTVVPYDEGMRLESIADFRGSSHDRITEEIWVRRERAEE